MQDSITGDWRDFQELERQNYLADYEKRGDHFRHFSVPEFGVTDLIADRIEVIGGPILDVGCGILPRPNYLGSAPSIVGVDPYFGEYKRLFPFAQAIGEHLPFGDAIFHAVLLMSVLDHAIIPWQILDESWRVLTKNGKLFVWYINRDRTDNYHRWIFNTRELAAWLEVARFEPLTCITYSGDSNIGYPKTNMIIARKK